MFPKHERFQLPLDRPNETAMTDHRTPRGISDDQGKTINYQLITSNKWKGPNRCRGWITPGRQGGGWVFDVHSCMGLYC